MERSAYGEPTCRVVLLGPVREASRGELVTGLQQRFGLTAAQAETLLKRAPVAVKKGLSIEKANALLQRLEEIGARVRIERVFPEERTAVPPRPDVTPHEPIGPETEEISQESYCSWEDMENLGFMRAFFGTMWEVLFRPAGFFSRMPVGGGLGRPLVFALLMGVLGGVFGLIYQFLMMYFLGSVFSAEGFGTVNVPLMIGSAIGLPIITIIGVFIGSGVLHVSLMIVRGNRRGFEATFRVIAYAMSTQMLAIIPLLGGLVGGIWSLVIEIIGLRESHDITTGRAVFAVFLPILVIVFLGLILAAIMIPMFLKFFSDFAGNL
ncbi:MAG: hypothetical protein GTN81_01605 [Proteobacteria bacterium]|nr:hypothetical protein [Pseudomonadota bacterium]